MTTVAKAMDVINKGVHLSGAVLFNYSLYYYYTYVNVPAHLNPLDEAIGGKFKYLTFCNLVIQAVFYLYAVIVDQFSSSILKRSQHYLFTIFAFPLSMFIAVSFWPLWFTDKSLVMPMHYDLYFPPWLNHVTHAHIFIFALLEMITAYREYPPRITGLTIFILFKICYLVWVNYIFYNSGMWVYPILAKFNWLLRTLFFLGTFLYAPFTYVAGEYINNTYWNIHPSKKSRASKINKNKKKFT